MTLDILRPYPLVYLATPYTKYPGGIDSAFIEAAALAARLLEAGVNVYSPIAHTHPIAVYGELDPLDHSLWLPFDAAIMGKADALVVAKMVTWEASFGIRHEINVFGAAGKPTFYLHPKTLELSHAPA